MNECRHCGKQFVPKYRTGGKNKNIYCGVDCRVKAWRPFGFQKADQRLIGNHNGIQFYKGQFNELQPNWKGDAVGYAGMHKWVQRHKGKAMGCVNCNKIGKSQWANVDGQYQRNLDDYVPMCSSCHKKYDLAMRKSHV